MIQKRRFILEKFELWYTDYIEQELIELGYTQQDIESLARELVNYANSTPPTLKGDVIKKSGGAVKLRLAPKRAKKGARNEDRLVYCSLEKKRFIFLAIYSKSEKENLSARDVTLLAEAIKQLKAFF